MFVSMCGGQPVVDHGKRRPPWQSTSLYIGCGTAENSKIWRHPGKIAWFDPEMALFWSARSGTPV